VNSREQLAALISLNCDAVQGAITGHPARAADLVFELEIFAAAEAR
jgi:EAL domain-containing protein (putative c-di-GMP-specific phosphodiesterase class I)